MKTKILLLAIMSIFLLGGCKPESMAVNTSDNRTWDAKLNMDEESKKQAEREKQTLWYMLDEKGNKKDNLPEDHPEVTAVKKITELHTVLVDNRSYKTVNAGDELKLYSKGFIKNLTDSGYDKALSDMFRTNQIETRLKRIAWYESTFDYRFTFCRVIIDSEFSIVKCSQSYLDKNKLKLDTIYTQQRIIDFEKEDNVWKISRIQKSALDEQENKTPEN